MASGYCVAGQSYPDGELQAMQPEYDDITNRITAIDPGDNVDLSLWAMVFGSSPEEVRKAVAGVGPNPRAVRDYMRRKHLGMWTDGLG
jgi:hypothetical protein